MKTYELTCLISPELSAEKLTDLSSKISGFIAEQEGNTKNKTEPIRKKLGSAIKEKNETFLIVINFNIPAEKLKNLEKNLKNEDEILRFIIMVKKEKSFLKKKIPIFKKISKILEDKKEPIKEPVKEEIKQEGESTKSKKVELKEIDKKIEEILNE